ARDPETYDNFRLGPAERFEVMMDGSHFEDALAAAELIAADLQNYGERFEDVDATDEREQYFLLNQDRDHAESAAERHGANVAHKDLGRMAVVPKKPKARTDHAGAEDGQLLRIGQMGEIQVVRKSRVARYIGERRHCAGRDDHQTDGEAVQAVR